MDDNQGCSKQNCEHIHLSLIPSYPLFLGTQFISLSADSSTGDGLSERLWDWPTVCPSTGFLADKFWGKFLSPHLPGLLCSIDISAFSHFSDIVPLCMAIPLMRDSPLDVGTLQFAHKILTHTSTLKLPSSLLL